MIIGAITTKLWWGALMQPPPPHNWRFRKSPCQIGLGGLSCHGRKHSQTIFTIEILIKILTASFCMIEFFCRSMAVSNFCDDWKSALKLSSYSRSLSFSKNLRESYSIVNTKLLPRKKLDGWNAASWNCHSWERWFIELGFHNYFILKRYRFLTRATFIGSASTRT